MAPEPVYDCTEASEREKEIYKRLSWSWLSDTEMCEIRGETSSLYTQRKSKYRIAYQSPSIPDVPQKAIA